MTAIYDAPTNTLKELPEMDEPKSPFNENYTGREEFFNSDMYDWERKMKVYNAHIASLRVIPCDPSCWDKFVDKQVYEERKDYEVKEDYQCSRHTYLLSDEGCDGKTTAVPLSPPVHEDEFDHFIELFRERIGIGEIDPANLEWFKKRYFITKKTLIPCQRKSKS